MSVKTRQPLSFLTHVSPITSLFALAICFAMRKAFSRRFSLIDRLTNFSATAFDFTSYTCLHATCLASMYLSLLHLPFFYSFQSRLFSLITFSTFPSHHHVDFCCAGPLVRPHTFSVESSKIFLSLRQFPSTSSVSSQARHYSSTQDTNSFLASASLSFHTFSFGMYGFFFSLSILMLRSQTTNLC